MGVDGVALFLNRALKRGKERIQPFNQGILLDHPSQTERSSHQKLKGMLEMVEIGEALKVDNFTFQR